MLVNGHLRARTQADCLMAAFAMFSLKERSLMAFVQRRQDQSLTNLYSTATKW
jgi:hypothetical protein